MFCRIHIFLSVVFTTAARSEQQWLHRLRSGGGGDTSMERLSPGVIVSWIDNNDNHAPKNQRATTSERER